MFSVFFTESNMFGDSATTATRPVAIGVVTSRLFLTPPVTTSMKEVLKEEKTKSQKLQNNTSNLAIPKAPIMPVRRLQYDQTTTAITTTTIAESSNAAKRNLL